MVDKRVNIKLNNENFWYSYTDFINLKDYTEFLEQRVLRRFHSNTTFEEWKEKYKDIKW